MKTPDEDTRRFRIRWSNSYVVKIQAADLETRKIDIIWTDDAKAAKAWSLDDVGKVHHLIVKRFTSTSLELVR